MARCQRLATLAAMDVCPGLTPSSSLILVRGVMVRSGTNFLLDLLCQHPDCAPSRSGLPEDFFPDEAHHLRRFVEGVADRWPATWGIDRPAMTAAMMRALGDGLAGFLRDGSAVPRIVAKCPSPMGWAELSALFPEARVVLLMRDGKGAVDSAMRSFGWGFERALQTWAAGAREVVRALQPDAAGRAQRLLVRYEDLLRDPEREVPRMLDFLDLDPAALPPGTVSRLPVRGSSESAGQGLPDWTPRPKEASFDPLSRGERWDPTMVDRFAWVAGDAMRALGYDAVPASGPVPRHRALDAAYTAERSARRLVAGLRRLRRRAGVRV